MKRRWHAAGGTVPTRDNHSLFRQYVNGMTAFGVNPVIPLGLKHMDDVVTNSGLDGVSTMILAGESYTAVLKPHVISKGLYLREPEAIAILRDGLEKHPCISFILRCQTKRLDEYYHKPIAQIRGYILTKSISTVTFQGLSQSEIFHAHNTDVNTHEPLPTEPGIEYIGDPVLITRPI